MSPNPVICLRATPEPRVPSPEPRAFVTHFSYPSPVSIRFTPFTLRVALAGALTIALLAFRTPAASLQERAGGGRWFKGNTHTHTTESDGDSAPDDVARWYREHGYQFLVLSDHNVLTSVEALNALAGAGAGFLLIKGEEVTDRFEGKPVHINGLDVAERVEPQKGSSVLDVLQRNVDAIRRVQGVPHINHPNFGWALSADDLARVRNTRLIEIYNGHPHVNNLGGGGVPGLEQAWDAILSSGTLIYGIAVDDAHTFKKPGDPSVAGPGRGWVMVRTDRLEARAILAALEDGEFYASTGVELMDYLVTPKAMTVTVKKDAWSKYRIQFLGKGGRVLHEALDSPAEYGFRGDEGYVRAKVIESNGRVAWTQPVMMEKR
jgi:hypothetical protein